MLEEGGHAHQITRTAPRTRGASPITLLWRMLNFPASQRSKVLFPRRHPQPWTLPAPRCLLRPQYMLAMLPETVAMLEGAALLLEAQHQMETRWMLVANAVMPARHPIQLQWSDLRMMQLQVAQHLMRKPQALPRSLRDRLPAGTEAAAEAAAPRGRSWRAAPWEK